MNEVRIRISVFIIILIAAIGIGAYVGTRPGSGTGDRRMGSGSISQSEFVPDPILAEQTTELTTEKSTPSVIPAPSLVIPAPVSTGVNSAGIQSPDKLTDDQLKSALAKAADSEDYTALGTALAEIYKRYPQGKKEFVEIESRAYVKATSYLDQEKNIVKARAAADAVYSTYPFGWRFKYLRVRVLERLGRDAFAAGDLASAEKYALSMLGMEFRPEGANLMGDIYLKRIDDALAKGEMRAAQAAYDEIKDYQVSPDRRKALDERLGKIQGL